VVVDVVVVIVDESIECHLRFFRTWCSNKYLIRLPKTERSTRSVLLRLSAKSYPQGGQIFCEIFWRFWACAVFCPFFPEFPHQVGDAQTPIDRIAV